MDTIQISIKLNENRFEEILYNDLRRAESYINSLESPYGHSYCDCLQISSVGNIVVKISYPRYFKGINAFLVTNSKQCMTVHNHFYNKLSKNDFLKDAEISLNRVDIPFTYIMNEKYEFYSFKKVYQIFNFVYKAKNRNVDSKAYADIAKFRVETLIYANRKSLGGYNSKITIYSQYKNLRNKTASNFAFDKLLKEYPDLKSRMRIEVSKRIQRKEFTIREFGMFDIFGEYVESFKKYLLKNMFDMELIDEIYEELTNELEQDLEDSRNPFNNKKKINYEVFIYKGIDDIYDYETLRRAVKMQISNVKTRENAITTIRRVLSEYEEVSNIIIKDTYSAILDIRETIENSFLD